MNKTVTTGVITRISSRDGVTGHLSIACPLMPGKKSKAVVVVNYPTIEFNAKTAPKKVGESFRVGDRVKVEGHLASYLRKQADGTTVENQFVYADEVALEKPKFEKVFGVHGRIYDTQVNDVYLKGVVVGINKTNTGSGYEMYITPEGEEKNRVRFVYFRKDADFGKEVHVGATVAVVAMIQSNSTPEREDKTGYDFQDIVASDVVKMED